MMFWTNWNEQHPSIMRAALSGANVLTLIEKDIRTPNGLAIDHRAEKLYFSDATLDKIERCEYDGSHRYVSVQGRWMGWVLGDSWSAKEKTVQAKSSRLGSMWHGRNPRTYVYTHTHTPHPGPRDEFVACPAS